MDSQTINFYIPDFYYFYNLNLKLILMIEEYPEYFYNNIKIKSIYGSFPDAIWNGGRTVKGEKVLFETASNIIEAFNNLNVSIRYTWTNNVIPPETKYDFYCNTLTQIANNGYNEILVNQTWLEEYLRKQYKNFSYISSITKCLNDQGLLLNEFDQDYELIVIPRKYNFDEKFLKQLLSPEKIEILINSVCKIDCPFFEKHHQEISSIVAGFSKEDTSCVYGRTHLYQQIKDQQSISVEFLYNYYKNLGIKNFKIEGRGYHPLQIIEAYVYYMVKPQWRDYVRQELFSLVIQDRVGFSLNKNISI